MTLDPTLINFQEMTIEDIQGKAPRKICTALNIIGLLLIAAGTLAPIFSARMNPYEYHQPWFKYVYAAGALTVLVAKLFSPYTGKVVRLKRLHRIEAWSAIFFCVAAFFMFYDPATSRDWLAFTLAGGAIQVIASVMITRVTSKEIKNLGK